MQERLRRDEVLRRRHTLEKEGIPADAVSDELGLQYVYHPVTYEPEALRQRLCWAVPHAALLGRNVDTVVEACEALSRRRRIQEWANAMELNEQRDLMQQVLALLPALK